MVLAELADDLLEARAARPVLGLEQVGAQREHPAAGQAEDLHGQRVVLAPLDAHEGRRRLALVPDHLVAEGEVARLGEALRASHGQDVRAPGVVVRRPGHDQVLDLARGVIVDLGPVGAALRVHVAQRGIVPFEGPNHARVGPDHDPMVAAADVGEGEGGGPEVAAHVPTRAAARRDVAQRAAGQNLRVARVGLVPQPPLDLMVSVEHVLAVAAPAVVPNFGPDERGAVVPAVEVEQRPLAAVDPVRDVLEGPGHDDRVDGVDLEEGVLVRRVAQIL